MQILAKEFGIIQEVKEINILLYSSPANLLKSQTWKCYQKDLKNLDIL